MFLGVLFLFSFYLGINAEIHKIPSLSLTCFSEFPTILNIFQYQYFFEDSLNVNYPSILFKYKYK